MSAPQATKQTETPVKKTGKITASIETYIPFSRAEREWPEGFKVATREGIKPATISKMITSYNFLRNNWGKVFLVSAKDAVDENNQPLKAGDYIVTDEDKLRISTFFDGVKSPYNRLRVTESGAKEIQKTKKDGKDRLVSFGIMTFPYSGGLSVNLTNYEEPLTQVAGELIPGATIKKIPQQQFEELLRDQKYELIRAVRNKETGEVIAQSNKKQDPVD